MVKKCIFQVSLPWYVMNNENNNNNDYDVILQHMTVSRLCRMGWIGTKNDNNHLYFYYYY